MNLSSDEHIWWTLEKVCPRPSPDAVHFNSPLLIQFFYFYFFFCFFEVCLLILFCPSPRHCFAATQYLLSSAAVRFDALFLFCCSRKCKHFDSCYFTYVKMLDNICIYFVVVYQNLILNSMCTSCIFAIRWLRICRCVFIAWIFTFMCLLIIILAISFFLLSNIWRSPLI